MCTSDYQCEITHYCWYKSADDRATETKRCMEMYSQPKGTKFGWKQRDPDRRATLEDYTLNGKFCLNGLAYRNKNNADEAICTTTDVIKFDGVKTNDPYNCTASDPNKRCQIVFEEGNEQEDYVEVFCRCSLSDPPSPTGYCESVIGTETYAKAVEAKKLLYRESKCHTLDRENMRA